MLIWRDRVFRWWGLVIGSVNKSAVRIGPFFGAAFFFGSGAFEGTFDAVDFFFGFGPRLVVVVDFVRCIRTARLAAIGFVFID